ncbi:hypothetical protein [Streptomyces canus]|uniref:hypothetical protein n=1 Tax=Streptomyces canus TaxID=58343 RepID=UPI0033AADE4D
MATPRTRHRRAIRLKPAGTLAWHPTHPDAVRTYQYHREIRLKPADTRAWHPTHPAAGRTIRPGPAGTRVRRQLTQRSAVPTRRHRRTIRPAPSRTRRWAPGRATAQGAARGVRTGGVSGHVTRTGDAIVAEPTTCVP